MTQQALPLTFSRRSLFGAGVAATVGALWSDWLRAGPAPSTSRRAKSVILIFNAGAPSHIDLWDMKPNAADNIRGLYQPISTNTPGKSPEVRKNPARVLFVCYWILGRDCFAPTLLTSAGVPRFVVWAQFRVATGALAESTIP